MSPNLRLEAFLPYRLSVVSNAISETIAAVYRDRFQLGLTDWRILAVLAEHDGASARQLVQLTHIDKVAISRALKRLQATGCVVKAVDGRDRRRFPLQLTEHGRALYAEIAPAVADCERALSAGLPEPLRTALFEALDWLERRTRSLETAGA